MHSPDTQFATPLLCLEVVVTLQRLARFASFGVDALFLTRHFLRGPRHSL